MNRAQLDFISKQLEYIESDLARARQNSIAGTNNSIKELLVDYKDILGADELTDSLEFLDNPFELNAMDLETLKISVNNSNEDTLTVAALKKKFAETIQRVTYGRVNIDVKYKLREIIEFNERNYGIIEAYWAAQTEHISWHKSNNPYQE